MIGVNSVSEIERNLTEENVKVPLSLRFTIPGTDIRVDTDAGCFIRGAGNVPTTYYIVYCVLISYTV